MATPEEEAELDEIDANGEPAREDVARFAGALARLIQGIEALDPPGIRPETDYMLDQINQQMLADAVYESFGLGTSKEPTAQAACWEFEQARLRFQYRVDGAYGYNREDVEPNGNIRMRPEFPPGARFNAVDLAALRKAHKLALLALDRMPERPIAPPTGGCSGHVPPADGSLDGWLVGGRRELNRALGKSESYGNLLEKWSHVGIGLFRVVDPGQRFAFWHRDPIKHAEALEALRQDRIARDRPV